MKIRILLLAIVWCASLSAQEEKIHWLTLTEADKLYQENPKPLIIDFYTDWCGWCKRLDQTTYANPDVISFVNRYFYPVKVNAEGKDTLYFQNKVYAPVQNGSRTLSSLAIEMLNGKLSYPTTVFWHGKENVNLVVPGYLEVLKMEAFLVYFIENAYMSSNVNDFVSDFEKVFSAKNPDDKVVKNYWTDFKDLDDKQKQEKKKILLFMSASWNNSSRMMEREVFADSAFSELAQRYFYSLHLDVQSQDSIDRKSVV